MEKSLSTVSLGGVGISWPSLSYSPSSPSLRSQRQKNCWLFSGKNLSGQKCHWKVYRLYIWNVSKQTGKFTDLLESFLTSWKLSSFGLPLCQQHFQVAMLPCFFLTKISLRCQNQCHLLHADQPHVVAYLFCLFFFSFLQINLMCGGLPDAQAWLGCVESS